LTAPSVACYPGYLAAGPNPTSVDKKEFIMKKLISIGLVAVLFGAGLSGCARDGMMNRGSMKDGTGKNMNMDSTMMDANSDGMVSKEEFMKHHEAMFDKMKKDSNGMVSMKDMQMMMDSMMMKK
jgi:hypothetical protein